MRFISIVAIFIGLMFLLILASPSQGGDAKYVFSGAAIFFLLLAFLNEKNGNLVDSPYISFAFSVIFLFYSLIGLISGEYTYKSHKIVKSADPQGFWIWFLICFTLGAFSLAIGLRKLLNSKKNIE